MSGFAVIYDQTNTAVDPRLLSKVMDRLSHRGPDGSDVLFIRNIAMGHWHFWTTPEEVGERQPLGLNGLPCKIVLDGRIDNRSEIISQLKLDAEAAKELSDATLVLLSYQHWGRACFERFVGEFALVIFDERSNELICARDHFGNRTLFYDYRSNHDLFVIASEPWAVLALNENGPELDESMVAHFFALVAPEDGRTFYKNVHELLPAHLMVVMSSDHSVSQYWRLAPSTKIRYKTEKEYVDQFRSLLEESIRCRMRSTTPVGVLMSGGLDSTSVTALASRMVFPAPLTTISNVYDELPECDEREYINEVKDQYNLNSILVHGDDTWPYQFLRSQVKPNGPEGNIYYMLKDRDYSIAHKEGLRVLLTGGAGDRLYIAGNEWLADLVMDGYLFKGLVEMRFQIQNKGLRKALSSVYFRSVIRAFLRKFAPWMLQLNRMRVKHPAWLRSNEAKHLNRQSTWVPMELEKHATLLGLMSAHGASRETFNASNYELELRHPYRDRRLIEFVVGIPAYLLYANGRYKHILRLAMQGVLPESILARKNATSLKMLYFRGLEREKNTIMETLSGEDYVWRRFVDSEWLLDGLYETLPDSDDERKLLVLWFCVAFEEWYKSIFSSN